MASSVFTDSPVPADSRIGGGPGNESQTNLVVVYGKNGMSVDRDELEELLEEGNVSSVSVVRISSPTPSMKDEDEGIDGDTSDLLSTLESGDGERPEIVGLTVEEFYPHAEAKKLAKEILNYAGASNPLQIKIDYEFQRFVIQNDHCYTPLTSPSQSAQKAAVAGETTTSSSSESKQTSMRHYVSATRMKKAVETPPEADDKKSQSEDDDEEYSDYSETSPSDSDNDRDSDLDFNVNDRGRRRKAGGRKTRKSITKTPKKRQSITDKDADEEPKKISAAVRGNRQSISASVGTSKVSQRVPGGQKIAAKVMQRPPVVVAEVEKVDVKGQLNDQKPRPAQQLPAQKLLQQRQHLQQRQIQQQQIQMQVQQQQQLIQQQLQQEQQKIHAQKIYLLKKDSGFSEGEQSSSLKPPTLVPVQSQMKVHTIQMPSVAPLLKPIQSPSVSQYSQPLPAKGFMPLAIETAAKNQLPAQISIQTHTSSNELAIENDKQLDLIDSIVKDELEKPSILVKDTHAGTGGGGGNTDIPQIVKMLESTESVVMNKAKRMDAAAAATSGPSFTSPEEHFDIANADLLDNPDDDLYKDLMQHVAELRNDKQLQDVIEKQVLDVAEQQPSGPGTSTSLIESGDHSAELMQESLLTDPNATPIRKDPIKIVRGDGRVITLPPIEAPTTRAKRRAQVQPATASATSTPKAVDSLVKDETVGRRQSADQRAAAAASVSATSGNKRNSVSSQSTNKDDETNTETEQEDEDDPDKLWCICRQPHNNRFMICCDKCEDWFHGTCVNITKAMGREMENSGKEWTCPNCVKERKKPTQKKITEIFERKPPPSGLKKIHEPRTFPATPLSAKKATKRKSTSDAVPPAALKNPAPDANQKKITDIIKQKPMPTGPPPLVKSIDIGEPKSSCDKPPTHPTNEGNPVAPKQLKLDPLHSCIVCKKPARPNSIYCSDDCIRRHAHNALVTANKAAKAAAASSSPAVPLTPEEKKKKMASSFEEALARAEAPTVTVKNKVERVYVFERKTGRILTGTNAPTTANLKKWLQENPTFEVVQPGSPEALAIERSKQRHQKMPVKIEPQPQTPPAKKMTAEPKFEQKLQRPHPPELVIRQPNQQPPLKKYPQQVTIKPSTPQTPNEPKTPTAKTPRKSSTTTTSAQSSVEKIAQPTTPTANDAEPIRINVRKTFKEQLIARMNEMNLPETKRLSVDEIEQFSLDAENEMFNLFNKDIGTKYKAKYRSLMFNIKDRKNQTLFQKILERKLGPRQLVRMSPEELASQELAEWRQNENKHQLEMIKKSELDLLSCAKNYVLKTHKGEEVIEEKGTGRVSLDMAIPVEDVVNVLNLSAVSSTSEIATESQQKESSKPQSVSDGSQDADSSFTASSLTDSGKLIANASDRKKLKKHEKERDRHHRLSKDKHKSTRKRSRSRSRDHRRDEKHKSPEGRSQRNEKVKSPHSDHADHKKEDEKKKDDSHSEKTAEKTDLKPKTKQRVIRTKSIREKPESAIATTCNLVDKILDSTKTIGETASGSVPETTTTTDSKSAVSTSSSAAVSTTMPAAPTTSKTIENSPDSDQEPTSTVNIPTTGEDQYNRYANDLATAIWSGIINMIDVATFQIGIQPVLGVSNDLDKQLPVELDVVGRIGPDTVWDYIGKIKKSPNKEIVIVRLVPLRKSESTAYSALYRYLNDRRRLGVVKTVSQNMKDFYILPMAAGKRLPMILQPQEPVAFFEDDTRPDLLLGIIIRIMGKRSANASGHHSHSKVARKSEQTTVISTNKRTSSEDHYTPPASPKMQTGKKNESKSIIAASRMPPKVDESIDINEIITPPATKMAKGYSGDDADEPYSPGDSSEDDVPLSVAAGTSGINAMDKIADDELKRKMDEINRQIEARKMEIAGMLGMDQKSSTYDPNASEITPALANISIPSNLQQILASIKPTQDATAPPPPSIGPLTAGADEDEEYVPEPAAPSKLYKPLPPPPVPPPVLLTVEKVAAGGGGGSRLAQLSEAELLSMVPDDMELDNEKSTEDLSRGGGGEGDSNTSDEMTGTNARWTDEPPPPGLEGEFDN